MLFTVLFGVFSVAVFSLRALIIRMKYRVSGESSKVSSKKIPIAIHCEHKRYWNIFEPILDEFEKKQQKIVYLTGSEDDPVFQKTTNISSLNSSVKATRHSPNSIS